jgi:hypothetical protein
MTVPAGWKPPIETTALGTERIIWHNELTKGFFHKQVVDTQRITNYRVIQNNYEILLKDVDDIVVMNQNRISQSSHMGTYSGRYVRFGYGTSRSTGVSVGDVVFMYQGRPSIIFRQITDPNGVSRLAKSARKQLLAAIKATAKLQAQSEKQATRITKMTKRNINENVSVGNITLNCPRCSSNPKGSKYCNKCGLKIDIGITVVDKGQYSNAPAPATNVLASLPSDSGSMKQVKGAEFLTYQSSFYKLKINYPVNWTRVETGLEPPGIVGFISPREDIYDNFLENVTVAATLAGKEWTLDQFVQTNIDDLKKNNPGIKFLESIPITLANMPAHRVVYDIGRSRYHMTVLRNLNRSSYQTTNNIFFMILYLAEISKYPNFLSTAQKITNSFEFIS